MQRVFLFVFCFLSGPALAQSSFPAAQVDAALSANAAYAGVAFEDRGPLLYSDTYPTVGNQNMIRYELRAQSATACDGEVALLSVRRNEFHAARTKRVFAGDSDYFSAPLWGDNSDSYYPGYYKQWLTQFFPAKRQPGSEALVEKCSRAPWLLFDEYFEGVATPVRTIVMQGRTRDSRYSDVGAGGGDVPINLAAVTAPAPKPPATPAPVQPLTDAEVETAMLAFLLPYFDTGVEQAFYDLTPVMEHCFQVGRLNEAAAEDLIYASALIGAHAAYLDTQALAVGKLIETVRLRVAMEIALSQRYYDIEISDLVGEEAETLDMLIQQVQNDPATRARMQPVLVAHQIQWRHNLAVLSPEVAPKAQDARSALNDANDVVMQWVRDVLPSPPACKRLVAQIKDSFEGVEAAMNDLHIAFDAVAPQLQGVTQ